MGGEAGGASGTKPPAPPAVDEPDAVLDEPAATGGDSVDGDSAAPVHTPPAADTPREEDRDLPDTPRSHTELGTVYGLIHTGDGTSTSTCPAPRSRSTTEAGSTTASPFSSVKTR